jgi:hypothetical protein
MKVSKTDSVVNYANFINEVYNLTHKAPAEVSMQRLCRKHRVATTVCTKLKEEGVLRRGHKNTYRWMGPAPTPQFIAQMRNSTLQYHREMAGKDKSAAKDQLLMDLGAEARVTPIVSKTKRQTKRTFSFFWGLVKFNY